MQRMGRLALVHHNGSKCAKRQQAGYAKKVNLAVVVDAD